MFKILDKKSLSERDICTKFITSALEIAGWNKHTQLLEEVSFTEKENLTKVVAEKWFGIRS